MKYKILNENDYKLTKWSGGYTKELYIYPETAEYKERNFMFRISSATVENEESVFTKLNGISRVLMPITGKLKLIHKNRYEKTLEKFEVENFSGDWDTTSYGKAADFNLMTNSKCTGTLEHFMVLNNDKCLLKIKPKQHRKTIEYIYNLGKEVFICIEDKRVILNNKETFMFDLDGNESEYLLKIINTTNEHVDLIRTTVYFK
ncbi:HutD family protein [uncultured Clostridium sp.]|uniref:HutD family protein n=1 Tax=uncultured Clostridium sp. TaxID=59620 RepID=UPI0025D5BF65|nr:HutD family protein [uncultured Clostridium sp.]